MSEQAIPKSRVRQGELLAGMINDHGLAMRGAEVLAERHFTQPKAKRLLAAIKAIVQAGETVDMASVAERVEGVSMSEVADLSAMGVSKTHWEFVLSRHLDDTQRADAAIAISDAVREINTAGDHAETQAVIAGMNARLQEIMANRQVQAATPEEIAAKEIARIAQHGHARRWRFPCERLQGFTGGLGAGEFAVLAARPSVGKTTMALNMATWASRAGASVLFLSLEMSAWEITRSLMRIAGNRPLGREADPCELREAAEAVRGLDIRIEEASGATGQTAASRVRRLHRERPVDIVIIDYLQRLRGDGGKSRYEDMTNISNDLADLAHGTGIAVLALAQLNRGVEQRKDGKPKMSDLRESGAIEQDADMIFLMHRMDNSTEARSIGIDVIDLDIAKNRTGPTGGVQFSFQKATGVFQEIE
jgi:replicative DNA helicase